MILRCAHTNSDECKLPGLPSRVNCVRSNCEVSNIVILSEVADAKPIYASKCPWQVAQDVYRRAWAEVAASCGGCQVLVLLQDIKSEHGSHIKWLLPFPGDWHILLTISQPSLNLYADAGLSKLAEVSGHRSETLTSLLQCKNFRKTHNLLLQTLSLYFKSIPSSESSSSQQSPHTTEQTLQEDLSVLFECFYGDKVSYQRLLCIHCTLVGIRYRSWELWMGSLKQQAFLLLTAISINV